MLVRDYGMRPAEYDGMALVSAAGAGNEAVVAALLAAGCPAGMRGNWALRAAAGAGHAGVVELLLRNGADVHSNRDTALREAHMRGHAAVVKVLLRHGADRSALPRRNSFSCLSM